MACPFAMRQRTIEPDALFARGPVRPRRRVSAARPIRGIVVDPAGSPLPGATVAIDSGDESPVTTAADGRFEITAAAPGWRRLTITLPGFRSSDATTFVPGAGHRQRCARRTADHASAARARRDRQRDRHPRAASGWRGRRPFLWSHPSTCSSRRRRRSTMCCGACRGSVCFVGPRRARRTRRRRAHPCGVCRHPARAVRWCWPMARRSTTRLADGSTGTACRRRRSSAWRSCAEARATCTAPMRSRVSCRC